MSSGKKVIYWLVPVMGILFVTCYIRNAVCDVIYTDYVRLINSYLPDVLDPSKFLVADIFTRIPINYLARIVNVYLFHYSTMFDMMLGAAGLGISAFILTRYCAKKNIGMGYFLAIMLLIFSLNKWEMLINGSGWVHFMAFACFYYHYYVWDRFYAGEGKRYDAVWLMVLPWLITLGVAGPYCAIYSVTMILTCLFCGFMKEQRGIRGLLTYIKYACSSLLSLCVYLWSNSYAVEEHAGAVDWPLIPTLLDRPVFFIRFFIKSFASMIVGGETAAEYGVPSGLLLILGMVVIAAYCASLYLNIRYRLYEKSVLPLVLTAAGGLNHVLIVVSRWIFLKEDYGMSSRYALQFQIGMIGIFLTFALAAQAEKQIQQQKMVTLLAAAFILLLSVGNIMTTDREIKAAPYRQEYFIAMQRTGLNFEHETDQTLKKVFQYHDGAKTRKALMILKENHWNLFSNK